MRHGKGLWKNHIRFLLTALPTRTFFLIILNYSVNSTGIGVDKYGDGAI